MVLFFFRRFFFRLRAKKEPTKRSKSAVCVNPLCVFFRLRAKKDTQKMMKYRCEKAHLVRQAACVFQ
jgi:hypothetical protein